VSQEASPGGDGAPVRSAGREQYVDLSFPPPEQLQRWKARYSEIGPQWEILGNLKGQRIAYSVASERIAA